MAAQAQTAELPIRVHVPFAFQAGNTTFGAANCRIFVNSDRFQIVNTAIGERNVLVQAAATRGKNDPQSAVQFVHQMVNTCSEKFGGAVWRSVRN